jgi:hypothetical protein
MSTKHEIIIGLVMVAVSSSLMSASPAGPETRASSGLRLRFDLRRTGAPARIVRARSHVGSGLFQLLHVSNVSGRAVRSLTVAALIHHGRNVGAPPWRSTKDVSVSDVEGAIWVLDVKLIDSKTAIALAKTWPGGILEVGVDKVEFVDGSVWRSGSATTGRFSNWPIQFGGGRPCDRSEERFVLVGLRRPQEEYVCVTSESYLACQVTQGGQVCDEEECPPDLPCPKHECEFVPGNELMRSVAQSRLRN